MDRRSFLKHLLTLAGGAGTLLLAACYGIPKGTLKEAAVGGVKVKATGAGIVKADARQTTFAIKCARCGYEAPPMTIDTPAAGQPYTLAWVCPRCGHKQTIVIEVVGD